MKTERSLLPFETSSLPLPTQSCAPFGLLYHPVEKCLWMLAFPKSQLWRYAREQWSRVSDAADLMPTGFSAKYSWSFHFHWDGARKAAVCFASGYGGDRLPVMGVWDGKRFADVKPKGALESSNRDAFAWDEGRNVLVHFVAARDKDPRYASGTLHARELDARGVWRDVGPAQKITDTPNLMAGYDGDLGATVCISADGIAFAWDGVRWRTVPVETTYPWFPYATAPAPGTRALVFAYAPRETGKWPAHVLEQSKAKLRPRAVSTMRYSGGMAHDPDRDVTYVFGPWFGDGTLQRTLGTYEAGTFRPAGRVHADQAPLVGPGHFFRDGVSLYRLRLAPDGSPLAEILPAAPSSLGVVTTHRGIHAVAQDGEVASCAFEGEVFARSAKAPGGFEPRTSACLGADYEGDRLLVVSGSPPSYGPFLKDAWLLQAGTWKKLALTGAGPTVTDAALTYDPARARWILAGGRDKSFKDGPKTFETDEAKWKSFPSRFVNAKGKATGATQVTLMAYDAPSGQTFCLAGQYGFDQPYVYEGEGAWRLLDEASSRGAFDVTTRRLAWREVPGDGLVRTLDLGTLLASRSAPKRKAKAKPGPPTLADEVWLRYQDEGKDVVWFARLEDASFTVRFGKRGSALKTKTTACKSAALARGKFAAAIEEKVAKGYEHAPEGEAVARLPGKRAWHIVVGRGKAGDGWGGVPKGVGAREWPKCAECKAPLIHVATLHADPERLPLKKHAALVAFVCGNELCEVWDPEMGANKVLLRTAADLGKPSLKAPPKGVEAAKPWSFGYEEVFEIDEEAEPNAPSPESCDKVGGYPAWLQGDDRPSCKTCDEPMRFAAQLNEHDLNFTGGGMSYVFVCDAEHDAVLLMQR